MPRHQIIAEIDLDGNVTFHAKGIKGKGCLKVLKEMAEAVGDAEEPKLTPEYYQSEAAAKVPQKG